MTVNAVWTTITLNHYRTTGTVIASAHYNLTAVIITTWLTLYYHYSTLRRSIISRTADIDTYMSVNLSLSAKTHEGYYKCC
jgi:hypothetical protein